MKATFLKPLDALIGVSALDAKSLVVRKASTEHLFLVFKRKHTALIPRHMMGVYGKPCAAARCS
jgi:hypothetical protein